MHVSYLDETILPYLLHRMNETNSWHKLGFWIQPPNKLLKVVFDEKKTLVFYDATINHSQNIHAVVILQNVGIDKRFPTLVVEMLLFSEDRAAEIIEQLKQLANMMSKRYLRIIGCELSTTDLRESGVVSVVQYERYYRQPDGNYNALIIGSVDLAAEYPDVKREYKPLTDNKTFYPNSETVKKQTDHSVDVDLRFRWIQPSDARFLARFDNQWAVVRSVSAGVYVNQRSVETWKRLLADPVQLMRSGVFLVAEDTKTNEVVASCTIFQDLTRPGKFHVGEMGITVAAEYQGMGIGTRLLKEAFTTSMKKGIRLVVFTSFDFNTAASQLYEKLGCTVVGTLPGWFVEGEVMELFWEKWLG